MVKAPDEIVDSLTNTTPLNCVTNVRKGILRPKPEATG